MIQSQNKKTIEPSNITETIGLVRDNEIQIVIDTYNRFTSPTGELMRDEGLCLSFIKQNWLLFFVQLPLWFWLFINTTPYH